MKRDLPDHLVSPAEQDDRNWSLLASRMFWIGGLLWVLGWGLAIYLVYHLR